MVTIFEMLPEIVEPAFVIELATTAVINDGTLFGGEALLPGWVVPAPPQTGKAGLSELANPLKPLGTAPPLNEL